MSFPLNLCFIPLTLRMLLNSYLFIYLAPLLLRGRWDISSPTRDKACAPALEAWSLNHWTTREVPCHENTLLDKERCVMKYISQRTWIKGSKFLIWSLFPNLPSNTDLVPSCIPSPRTAVFHPNVCCSGLDLYAARAVLLSAKSHGKWKTAIVRGDTPAETIHPGQAP